MFNTAILVGRLGADPEIRTGEAGARFAVFRLATSDWIKGREVTEWHSVSVLDEHLVEVCEKHLKSGTLVVVQGAIRTRSWDKDGVTQYRTGITVGFEGRLQVLAGRRPPPDDDRPY
jgi:single-strand DNA-binding protein